MEKGTNIKKHKSICENYYTNTENFEKQIKWIGINTENNLQSISEEILEKNMVKILDQINIFIYKFVINSDKLGKKKHRQL